MTDTIEERPTNMLIGDSNGTFKGLETVATWDRVHPAEERDEKSLIVLRTRILLIQAKSTKETAKWMTCLGRNEATSRLGILGV